MKVRVDLQKNAKLASGNGLRYAIGDLDAAGILWLDEAQEHGRRVAPGSFIVLQSLVSGVRIEAPKVEQAAKKAKGEATA